MSPRPAPFAISTEEILEALAAAAAPDADRPPGVFTGPEIREAIGWTNVRFAKEVAALHRASLVELVKVRKVGIDGRNATVVGYRFLKKPKAA